MPDLEIEPTQYLRIKSPTHSSVSYEQMLGNLLIAEAILAKKGNSAMQHFIAVVKELERLYGFSFEMVDREQL
jgi:hypothetical protein